MIRYVSLFSGIEAASVAFAPLGWQAVAFAEVDPFCCAVLKHHYPDVPNLGDMTAVTAVPLHGLKS
jgi:DNA (cytosine-5)-methyltransferase 1